MPFDATTAQPESATRGFDPTSATLEDERSPFKFNPASAISDDVPELKAAKPRTLGQSVRRSLSPLIGETAEQRMERAAARQWLGTLGIGPALDRSVTPGAEKTIEQGVALTPLVQNIPRAPANLPDISTPLSPLSPAALGGIYNAGAEFVEGFTSPAAIGTLGAGGALAALAKGYGPAAAAARLALRGMGLGFGAQMAHEAGGQAGAASVLVNDPTKTTAEKTAAVAAPVLTGVASLAAAGSAFAPMKPQGPRPLTSDERFARAQNVTPPTDAELSKLAIEAKKPLALPEPKLPATELAPTETKPAAPAVFREGQEVIYTAPDGQEARGIVAAPTATGRVKITTQEGDSVRIPIERVSEPPADFDPASAVEEIEATISEPDEPPAQPEPVKQVSPPATIVSRTGPQGRELPREKPKQPRSAHEILEEALDDRSHGDDYLEGAAQEIRAEMKARNFNFKRKLTTEQEGALIEELQRRRDEISAKANATDIGEPTQRDVGSDTAKASPPPAQIEPVDIGPRDATVSTGDGVATAKEAQMIEDWKKANSAELAEATPVPAAPEPSKPTYSISAVRRQQKLATELTAKADAVGQRGSKPRAAAAAKAAEDARLKLAEMLANQAPAERSIGVGLPAHGEPDLLNVIEELGGINAGTEAGGITSTFTGAAKQLIKKSGQDPDQVAQQLADDGWIKDGHPETMKAAVTAALQAREVSKGAAEKNSFVERFERAFLGNQHPRTWLRAGKAISIDDLKVGDRFEIDGEKFHVSAISEDGVVTVQDGITREIAPGTPIFPDKGKIKKAKVSTDFLPVEMEEPGGAVVPIEPTKLAGGEAAPAEGFSLETVTPEQQATEAAAKREADKAQAQRDKIAALAEKPLVGDSSDVGQGVLLSGDEDLFSGESAESAAKKSPTFGSQRGAVDPQLLRALAVIGSGAGGAAYGYSKKGTPEEKIKNALLYGALAAIGMRLGTSPAIWRVGRSALFGNKELPNMRKVSDEMVNAANHVKGARLSGVMDGLNLAAKVLGDKLGDPIFAERLGSVLVQEMQEAKIIQLHDDLLKATTPGERHRIQTQIDNVKPVWDMPATQINSPAEFRAALADPEIIAAIDRHKTLVQAEAERIHTELGGKLAAVGPNTGAFINTEAILVGDRPIAGQSRGNLQNVLKRKTAFGKGRTGAADQYEIDYNRQVARMAAGNAERIATKEYYDTAEAQGAAMRLPPGDRPPDAENWRRERTQELSVTGKVEDTWIRKDIWGEHRHLMNTDNPITDNDLRDVAKEMVFIQMKGVTDPVFHTANIVSQIVAAQGASNIWADLGRQFPGINLGDALIRTGVRARDLIKNDPKTLDQLARLAKIGALRDGHPGLVNLIDRAARLVMSDFHANLVERGLVDASELSERDFVNKIGQYDARVMGQTKAFLKDLQVAPFVVAGQGMNRAGVQKLFMHPGVKPKDAAAWAKMVGVNLAGLIASAVVVPFAANYLLNRNDDRVKNKLMGPPGTPVGAIGLIRGEGPAARLVIIDPLKWTGQRRGARITGINALANGLMQGRDLNHSGGQAMQDIVNGAVQPWAGPAVNATLIAATGKSTSGFQEAEKVNPLDRTDSPTIAQSAENVKTGVTHLQAQVSAGLQEARRTAREQQDFTAPSAAGAMLKSLGGAVGVRETKVGDAERGPAESARYAEEVQQDARHKATASLAARWPKMTQAEKEKATANMTELDGKDLVEALRQNSLGFTPADRMIHSMGVEDGARAKYLAGQIMKLKGDELIRYLDDKERKGLITENVGDQLAEELQARGFKPPVAAR